MSTTKQQRIATGMMWAARVIGCGATVFLLGVLFLSLMWRALWASDILFLVYLGIALAGCIVSSRRLWLAGTILVLVSLAFGSALGLSSPWGIAVLVSWTPQLGAPFLVAGVLFLLSWWLSRKTSLSASTVERQVKVERQRESLEWKTIPAFALCGALWFGIGGVIAGTVCAGNDYLLILGFIILGGLGGGALGLVFGGGKKVGPLALGGAIGFGFGFTVGLSLEFSGFTGILEPIYEGLLIGCVIGAIGGGALGLALRSWRASGILALAGAFGLGIGTYLSLFIGMTSSGMTSSKILPQAQEADIAKFLGLVSLFLMGALTGIALGAALSWIKRLKTENGKSGAKLVRRRISRRLNISVAIFTFLALAALLAWYVTSATSRAEIVEFPDKNLRVVVKTSIGKWLGGQITDAELTKVTELHVKWRVITDLSGLEYCTSLTTLILYGDQISGVSSLSSLTNLTTLTLSQNQISDISSLSSLTELEELSLNCNPIANVSPLSSLTNLTYLELSGNQISDVSPLSSLTSLATLRLDQNQINDISALSSLTKLTALGLGWNQISDISPLASLTSLSYLFLDGNQISDISPLASLTNLSQLYLERNQISDISALSSLTKLTALWLQWNQISDISPLVENAGIGEGDEVWIGQNNLDLSEGSEDMYNVGELQKRYVGVVYLEY